VVVAGAGGDGPWYEGLRRGTADAGINAPVQTFRWGAPGPLFVLNLQDRLIHEAAEAALARRLRSWRGEHPDGRIWLVAHSAGCGVALGALRHLDQRVRVDGVVLLAPSVSPGYDLGPSLRHVNGAVHVFFSQRDKLWLRWRTGTFGTYDNIRTQAAGHSGFTSIGLLEPQLRAKVIQHPYDPKWRSLGNDGTHFGALARAFASRIVAPLLAGAAVRDQFQGS
jgi:pimeloyl-ACP methyl ester carboxylesterase